MLKKIIVVALRFAGAVGFVIVVLLGAILLANIRDEELSPEVSAFLKSDRPRLPDAAQNAWFHAVGMAVEDSRQPHAAGAKWAEAVEKVQAERLKGQMAEWPKWLGGLPAVKKALCTGARGESCVKTVGEKTEEARKLVAENPLLLARYRELLAYQAYGEATEPLLFDNPIAGYSTLAAGHRLWQVDAALRLQNGEFDAVLADLEKDLAFSRRMLAGARSLIGKLVAAGQVNRSAVFASEVLTAYRAQLAGQAAGLQKQLQPLSTEERSLGTAIRTETRIWDTGTKAALRSNGFAGLWGDDSLFSQACYRLLFQPNATLNVAYAFLIKPSLELDAAPASQYDGLRAKLAAIKPEFSDWTLFYNPIGKLLVIPNLGTSFHDYIARIHDIDGLLRLVALQAGIVAAGTSDEGVPAFLAAADKAYADPYTGKPMAWDPKARQIHFQPRSSNMKQNRTGGVEGRVGVTL